MQIVEEGSVIHRNLSRMYALLWPNEIQALDTTCDVTEQDDGKLSSKLGICPKLPAGMEVYQYRKAAKYDDHGKEIRPEVQLVRYEGKDFSRTYLLTDVAEAAVFKAMDAEDLSADIAFELAKAPIEFPMDWIKPAETNELDDVTQEELGNIIKLGADLHKKIEKNLDEISRKANRFVEVASVRDHDLYMTFGMRGPENLQFSVRFDKVYPTISESGEFFLGQGEKLELDIAPDDHQSANILYRIGVLEKSINRDILRYRNLGNFGEAALKAFNREVRTLLLAAAHFSRRMYPFDAQSGKAYLEEASNTILEKLYAFKANKDISIGLDVNSWIVWQYFPMEEGREPEKLEDESLNFVESVLNRYTETFVNVLTGYLMDLGHTDVIRPYHHLVKADPNDGIEVGSIRQVS